MSYQSLPLKIKSKHLGEEARIIRFEEHKLAKQIGWFIQQHNAAGANEPAKVYNCEAYWQRNSLRTHRVKDVRRENRATFLARAYIAGKPYASVEAKRKPEREFEFHAYVLPRVVAMVAKYGANKMPLKIYDRTKGGYIDNPALVSIKQQIEEWLN